jgi:hypothetical protein
MGVWSTTTPICRMRITGTSTETTRGDLRGAGTRRTFPPMLPRVARILLAVFCVTVVAQQTNLGSLIFGDECPESCPDDVAPNRCPVGCTACSCVGNGTAVSLALPLTATVRPAVTQVESDETKTPPDPQPDSIFHVPRPLLV